MGMRQKLFFLAALGLLAASSSVSLAGRSPILAGSAPLPFTVAAPCSLGEKLHGPPGTSVDFGTLLPTFYTRLDPDSCSGCGGAVVLRNARFRVESRGPSCTFSVEVTIIGARPGPACALEPDPGVVLCGPVPADVTIPLAPPRAYDASVPLRGDCCIDQPVFLRVRLVSKGACVGDPLPGVFWFYYGLDLCKPCLSFMEAETIPLHDTCTETFVLGNPIQWVDAECCDRTPTQRGTWGQLKSHYR